MLKSATTAEIEDTRVPGANLSVPSMKIGSHIPNSNKPNGSIINVRMIDLNLVGSDRITLTEYNIIETL